jgi:sugar lactone lactonase YvrE
MTHPRLFQARGLRRLIVVGCSTLLLGVPAAAGHATTAADAAASSGPVHARVIARFAPVDNTFAESLAIDSHGTMYVSKTVWGATPDSSNTGRIVRVAPTGERSGFGPRLHLGPTGMLLGVAIDARDRVYVARYDFGGTAQSEIDRVAAGRVRPVATLPLGAWPNGLAFHEGRLYVGDAALGALWRFRPAAPVRDLTRPWVHSRLLAPARGEDIGVNGLAFWRDTLYAVNSTRGTLLRVTQGPKGHPGAVLRVTTQARLHTADGIAFDGRGRLWVTVNGSGKLGARPHGQCLLRLTRTGTVQQATKDARWMNYPTMLVRGRTAGTHRTMFLTNGAFNGGRATLVSFRIR